MTTDLLFGDVQMPPQNELAGGIFFQLLFEKVRRKGVGVMEDDNVGLKFAEGLFEQLSVGEGERLRGDLGKAARADDLHAVHLAARIPLFVVKTKYLHLVRVFERIRTIARDLLDPADKRKIIVTDLQYFHLYARFQFLPPAPRDADGGRGRSAYDVRNKKSQARRARNKSGTLVVQVPPIDGKSCAAACGVCKALRKMLRHGACAAVPSGSCQAPVGHLSDARQVSTENLSVACRVPFGRPSDPYQIQRCRNDKRFSRKGNTAKARRKDRNYNISAMPDPAALCATAK